MDDDVLQGFLEESWENLAQLDTDIVAFEKELTNNQLLDSIFRTIHTIKGTCGFVGLVRIGEVSHATENVLGKMREGVLPRTSAVISLVLEGVDALKELLTSVEASGQESDCDYTRLIQRLELIAVEGRTAEQGNEIEPAANPTAPDQNKAPSDHSVPASAMVMIDPASLLFANGEIDFAALDVAINEAATRHRQFNREQSREPQTSTDSRSEVSNVPAGTAAPFQPAASPTMTDSALPQKELPHEELLEEQEKKPLSDLSIRVHVNVLDRLMNLVGELVLVRNQLMQLVRDDEESKYANSLTHLNRITADLQEGVMKTRMQPIGNAWSKLPRLVRDLSQVTGKQIELELVGAETELDRTVLDAIKDPLIHMVRNSADHGLETTTERTAAGKPEKGTIRLSACHEGGHVILCVEDDGRGINTPKVVQKLIALGFINEAEAEHLSEYEIHQFLFRPGFSTVDQVSAVSGRGVGMDVVRTEIERIGGTVDLISRRGQGTTLRIKIPLTLAIIPALVVESGGQSFAIPQLGIVELVRLPAEDRHRIERVHDKQVFRLRNRLLPLVYLSDVLQVESLLDDDHDVSMVVVQVGEDQLGLIVDRVYDTEEIVVKPVGSLLREIGIYQGTTILGDGRVIMILDMTGIAAEFGSLNTTLQERELGIEPDRTGALDLTSLLVFDAGEQVTMAVPLALVSRLEEFPCEMIESGSNGPVVQYRGHLLPLQSVNSRSNDHQSGDHSRRGFNGSGVYQSGVSEAGQPLQPVIVFTDGPQSMGLMVEVIRDVVEEHLSIQVQSQRPGVLGTAIINGKATEVIDMQHYLMRTNPHWFRQNRSPQARILIVNGSGFFRQLLVTSLQAEQYRTAAVESPQQALEVLEMETGFDLLLVDFDHAPKELSDLLTWIRMQTLWQTMPVLGLCSHKTSRIEQFVAETGCDCLLEKLNLVELTQAIEQLCEQRPWNSGVSA